MCVGMKVIGNDTLVDSVQARTHRKKRINKKWLKRYGYKNVPSKKVFVFGNVIACHPSTARLLEAAIQNARYIDKGWVTES